MFNGCHEIIYLFPSFFCSENERIKGKRKHFQQNQLLRKEVQYVVTYLLVFSFQFYTLFCFALLWLKEHKKIIQTEYLAWPACSWNIEIHISMQGKIILMSWQGLQWSHHSTLFRPNVQTLGTWSAYKTLTNICRMCIQWDLMILFKQTINSFRTVFLFLLLYFLL